MNKEIEKLAQEGHHNTLNMISDIANIRMTVINIRISVAKLNNLEARALDTIANHIESSLLDLEGRVKLAGDRYNIILKVNKEDEHE